MKIVNPRQPHSLAGTLVWVRRRNGSWWPGRILAPEELPGSHLLSPRSGTPVKLLGREDASVDWYNIDKSKRVKAFRCGEFDDCIERAKTYAYLPSKKREKYARREDAILHALHLEKQQGKLKCMSGSVPDEREACDNAIQVYDGLNDYMADANTSVVDSGTTMNVEFSVPKTLLDDDLSGSMLPQGNQNFREPDCEDDNTEATPRMRGLQDFGLNFALSNSKKANFFPFEGGSKLSLANDDNRAISFINIAIGSGNIADNLKDSLLALKRKRCPSGTVTEENAYKKRDRRRPLTQVLESSMKLSGLDFHDFESSSKDLIFSPIQFGRETMAALQHHEIKLAVENFINSDGLNSQSLRQDFKLREHFEEVYRSRQDSLYSISTMDEACCSISDSLNVNDWVPLCLPSSVRGPSPEAAFVNSPFSEKFQSTCSSLSDSIPKGFATGVNDNGRDKFTSLSLPSVENIPHLAHTQLRHNGSFKDTLCNKFNQKLGLVHSSKELTWTANTLHDPVNNVSKEKFQPCYFPHAESLRNCKETVRSTKTHVFRTSGFPTTSPLEGDLNKSSKAFLRKDTLSVHCNFFGHMAEEDEVESFQTSTENSLVSKWQAKGRRSGRMPARKHVNGFYGCRVFGSTKDLEKNPDKQHDLHWRHNLEKQKSTVIDSAFAENMELTRPLQHDGQGVGSLGDHKSTVPFFSQEASFLSLPKSYEKSKFDPENICESFDSTWLLKAGVDTGELKILNCNSLLQAEPFWFDVKVESCALHQGESVPLVSLMSRLNGQAVIGYPIMVDKLECIYKVTVTQAADQWNINLETHSGSMLRKVSLRPRWKTARRTATPRVPRSCRNVVSSDFDGGINPLSRQTGQRFSKLGFSSYRRKLLCKNHALAFRSLSRKNILQRAGASLRKTRALSSFAVDKNVKHKFMESDTIIVSERPSLACIPVKLVFWRIQEVLYSQPEPVPSGNRCSVSTPTNQDSA